MRVITSDVEKALEPTTEVTLVTHKSYREMDETPFTEQDCISQLHSNLELLSDLQSRLSFVMREVRYLMKVSS